ncbi:LOW QUALITY PROTEIN: NF-kappa-B inhibitor beta [Tachyglossus aculeatus]|uniref:LOW QUALITY PROTEIN: NF-kappa-B inhibitor beta n=1 Tax=Tachyglossus aculeatus TaxID=9261 RepID=UPI0018F49BFE|nr:LOW QUALITY PROTEIN: NF-kappa-B inhibitor beta [Tachyglossus aculeatus]
MAGKAEAVDDWCDSGLGSLGGRGAAAASPSSPSPPPEDWAPAVLGYVTEDGDTVLHLAVIHQHEAFLEFLLQYTAGTQYLDLQNDLGQTALHIAVILGDATLAAKLRAAGAGLGVTERAGNTALHLACREGRHACARALLDPPAAAHRDREEEEEEQRLQRDAANYQGHTPLHVAVLRKDLEMVRLLRDAGVDLNKQEPTCGRSPLHLAVEAQSAAVLECLLRGGADPAARMFVGYTPLYSAARRPAARLPQLLRDFGAPEPADSDTDSESDGSPAGAGPGGSDGEDDEYDDIVLHGQTRN